MMSKIRDIIRESLSILIESFPVYVNKSFSDSHRELFKTIYTNGDLKYLNPEYVYVSKKEGVFIVIVSLPSSDNRLIFIKHRNPVYGILYICNKSTKESKKISTIGSLSMTSGDISSIIVKEYEKYIKNNNS